MLAVPEAEHLDVTDPNGPAGWRDVAHRALEDAVVRAGECAFLDGDVVDDVKAVHIDMRVRKGAEPVAIELNAGCLSLATQPTGRLEDDLAREHLRKPIDVVGIEGFRPPLERLAHRH